MKSGIIACFAMNSRTSYSGLGENCKIGSSAVVGRYLTHHFRVEKVTLICMASSCSGWRAFNIDKALKHYAALVLRTDLIQ